MKIPSSLAILAILATSNVLADDASGKQIPLEAPKDWKGETIEIPPGFARDMKLRGTEKIRFAPGMFDPKSESFFSYAIVFRLEMDPELTPKVLRRELLSYYRGLASSVLGRAGVDVDTKKFALKLRKPKSGKDVESDESGAGVEDAAGDKDDTGDEDRGPAEKPPSGVTAWIGELDWIEPFATRKPQTLRLEVHTWNARDSKHRYLFCCVSPKKPDASIWKQLRAIRSAFQKAVSRT